MKTQISIIAASLLALASVNANAQQNTAAPGGKTDEMQMMVQQYDLNKDGQISKEEFVQYSQQKFDGMDSDKNGVLSMDEYKKGHKGNQAMMNGQKDHKMMEHSK